MSIQQVSQMLNISKPTLRYWEKEFEGLLMPIRTSGGQRRYAPNDVEIIEEIKILKKAGLSLIEMKKKLRKSLLSKIKKLNDGIEQENPSVSMKEADDKFERYYELKRLGYNLESVEDRVCRIYDLSEGDIYSKSRWRGALE